MKITYSMVGMPHQKTDELVKALQPGTELLLVREPQNPYDPNAIAVWHGNRRLAYLPSKNNRHLAALMDERGAVFTPADGSPTMAMDNAPVIGRSMPCIFKRSDNSGYPQIVVEE